jgi:hypothetical protein
MPPRDAPAASAATFIAPSIAAATPLGFRDARIVGNAYQTLQRGTRMLAELAAGATLAGPWPDRTATCSRTRFVGNCLRELDRFLIVLMNEMADAPDAPSAPLPRNAALRIAAMAADRWDSSADERRLRALGRTTASFNYCRGVALRPDAVDGEWMTSGWIEPSTRTLKRYRLGERLAPSGQDLVGVSLFYRRLADRVVGAPLE